MATYIGIDGGINGGITAINDNQNVIESIVMPVIDTPKGKVYDIIKIRDFISKYENGFFVLEEAHTLPKNGAKQNFRTGECFGIMKAIIECEGRPFEIVRAKVWQKEIFQGQKVVDTKQASILYCRQKFPNIDWRASERCKKDHDGKTDSACMSVYCFRINK